MKKFTNLLTLGILVIIVVLIIGFIQPDKNSNNYSLNVQGKVSGNRVSELINSRKQNSEMKSYSLFSNVPKDANLDVYRNFMRNGATLTIIRSELKKILSDKSLNITLSLPKGDNSTFELELTKVNILTKDFKDIDASTHQLSDYTGGGLFYRGIIKGDDNSLAAISIFDGFVMGIISDMSGNYTLGSVKDQNNKYSDNYIFYNDKDKIHQVPFKCGDEGREDKFYVNNKNNSIQVSNNNPDSYADDTVKVYYETDYQMYLDNQSSQTLTDQFVMGFFNGVSTIYENESVHFAISSIGHHTTMDQYASMTTSDAVLNAFGGDLKDNFMGDLAQFLTTAHTGPGENLGGLAHINVLCQPAYFDNAQQFWIGRFSMANIDNNPLPYPTFSWTVEVSTHEMGHNLGSYHTHACHWDLGTGTPGPLDTCIVTAENSTQGGFGGCVNAAPNFVCYQPNSLVTSGFIMSYCHFCQQQGGGINFVNGFGRPFGSMWSQSGDTVRLRVSQANCLKNNLNSSDVPTTFLLMQNYPNPYNPATNIKFALPKEGFVTLRVYDITGREIGKLIDNAFYSVGMFSYSFDASLYNLASGVYFYKLDVNSGNKNVYSQIKKMVLIK
jgi:hypothetical protein